MLARSAIEAGGSALEVGGGGEPNPAATFPLHNKLVTAALGADVGAAIVIV